MTPAIPICTEEEWQEAKARTDAEWQRVVLPAGWSEIRWPAGSPLEGSRIVQNGKRRFIFSAGKHEGRWWLHVSVSHAVHMPSYTDLVQMKHVFVGDHRQAVQVFSPVAEHVNIHPHALHLWCCLEDAGDGLPRFGIHGTI